MCVPFLWPYHHVVWIAMFLVFILRTGTRSWRLWRLPMKQVEYFLPSNLNEHYYFISPLSNHSLQHSRRHSRTGRKANTPSNHVCMEGMWNAILLHEPMLTLTKLFSLLNRPQICMVSTLPDFLLVVFPFVLHQYNAPPLHSHTISSSYV